MENPSELDLLLWALSLDTLKRVLDDLTERQALYQGAHPQQLLYCLHRAADIWEARR